jgi:hypothetical protein
MPVRCIDAPACRRTIGTYQRNAAPRGRHALLIKDPRMTEKKAYPLRINADVLAAAQRWADDDLRSLNAQIEYVLRDALRKAGRLPKPTTDKESKS